MTEHDVVIAGGGPTGLMLAAELRLAGADVVVVERRPNQELEARRAGGLHSRTLEILDMRGVADRFVEAGTKHPATGFAYVPLDVTDFPTRHNYLLALWQREFEVILADWVLGELEVPIIRSREVVGFTQDVDGVDADVSDGSSLRAKYLVGCDGGRSLIRKIAGIDFPGLDSSCSFLIAEATTTEPPPLGIRPEGGGIGPVNPGSDDGLYGIVLKEQEVEHTESPTIEDLRRELVVRFGTDFGVHTATSLSRFSDVSRQAAVYRQGRVLLAGDAAHIHPPQGGQGLNIGIQDAMNLGWKLAQVVHGTSPDSLLDTYHAERHPIGARVLHNTQAQVALATNDERHPALREILTELLGMDEPRRRIAGMMTGLDVHYDLGEGHPLLGRRMPDLELQTAEGAVHVFGLMHRGNAVLLDLSRPGAIDLGTAADRLRVVAATCDGPWELPVIGTVDAPAALLIRPDGHVAWVGEPGSPTLAMAMATWFGVEPEPT